MSWDFLGYFQVEHTKRAFVSHASLKRCRTFLGGTPAVHTRMGWKKEEW